MKKLETISTLNQKALDFRENIVRLAHKQEFGIHVGGGLSLAEILTCLYFQVARVDPANPNWEERDRIILSKGHGNVGLLTILAMKGFFPFSVFEKFNEIGSYYSMHSDSQVSGVEHSAGSLGHGLSVAVGMALRGKRDKKSWQVYCILGDGESMEGSVWEALMSASHFNLDNLTAIIDRNHLSQEGTTKETMSLEPLKEKGEAFGWSVFEVDGHNIQELLEAFSADSGNKPKLIIANTIKGRGIKSLENMTQSHFGHLNNEQYQLAIENINNERNKISGKNNGS